MNYSLLTKQETSYCFLDKMFYYKLKFLVVTGNTRILYEQGLIRSTLSLMYFNFKALKNIHMQVNDFKLHFCVQKMIKPTYNEIHISPLNYYIFKKVLKAQTYKMYNNN